MSQAGSVPIVGQIHDYSPGIAEDGLFWTIAVPPEAVGFDPDLQTGFYRQTELDLVDAYNIPNALAGGPDVPGRVSFEVRWSATGPPTPVRNEPHGFVGEFRESRVTVAWSGKTDTSSFESDPAASSKSIYGFIGRERNGVFAK